MGHLKSFSRLDSEGADIPLSSGSKITSAPRDAYMPRNISCPVSSISSPLLHPKSPQRKSEQVSPIYNLRGGAPGSSPPHTVGSGNTPWTVLQQPATSLYEGIGIQRCRKNLYASVSPHKEWKHRFFHGIPQMSLPYKEIVSLINRQPKEQHDGRLVLADRVSSALEGSY
ncbi:hypothetical protein Nepgr_023817 [Nepenthes gracilis]|uniref:Uncharacterized protein n=1 Tax=Nepenthes gracilis TaxID=150966 RepID=A0AAD3XZF9_NEPGR|nr:hypothetical protein Nepgr_023817 [Nepenthes gracilis]